MKKTWPIYKKHFINFFAMCLSIGHHPKCFKIAVLCVFPKSKKRVCSEPRLYRLIAILSCLRKILERVVAMRLKVFVFKTKLFSNLHFKAVSGRSTIDAAAIFTHDVKKTIREKNVVSALAFDIKVSRIKLIK